MSTITDLQSTLQTLISKPLDASVIETLLSPAPLYLQDPSVMSYIDTILKILLQDRNGNNTVDIEDLLLLAKDMNAIIALVTAIVLLISNLPHVTIDYKAEDSELFIYKILVYIFLKVMPEKLNIPLTEEQLQSLLNLCNLIYAFLVESGMLKSIFEKIAGWAKDAFGKCFACMRSDKSVVAQKMPKLLVQLKHT